MNVGLYNIFTSMQTFFVSKSFEIIAAAFFGGLFAGLFSNYFESRRRIFDKRFDKYHEHRNTIVQIEHELIPARVNLSRNIKSLSDAIESTNENNIRLILRFSKVRLSTGLSLSLLDLNFINEYAEMFTLFERHNSDIDYVEGMIQQIRNDQKEGSIDVSLLQSYVQMIEYLQQSSSEIDEKSQGLLAMCQIALNQEDTKIKNTYLKNGKLITYKFDEKMMEQKLSQIDSEENRQPNEGESQPKFFVPFMDIKKVIRVAF